MLPKFVNAQAPTMAAAVRLVERELGGEVIAEHKANDTAGGFGFVNALTDLSDGQRKLVERGYVFDRYGRAWHNEVFDIAPPCQCPPDKNFGKLALMLGKKRDSNEFYRGWFCGNVFGRGANSGCKSVFNNNYPSV